MDKNSTTHWDKCWLVHHNCAIARIDKLETEIADLINVRKQRNALQVALREHRKQGEEMETEILKLQSRLDKIAELGSSDV